MLEALISDLGDIPTERMARALRQKSRDFFWFSPILKTQLKDCLAELIVCPRDEAEVVKVAAACVKRGVPLTLRGGGTGNYGQAVPLHGGVVMDMSALSDVHPVDDGLVRVGAGAKLKVIEDAVKPQGWELKLFPSTRRTATIGGFVAGGSGGVGSIAYGMLNETDAIKSARIVTMEAEPKIITLAGSEVNRVQHAYGTNGIITELEIPLAPATEWHEVVVAFDEFMPAAEFCRLVAEKKAVRKRLVTTVAWPIPEYFGMMPIELPLGKSLGLILVAPESLADVTRLAEEARGSIIFSKSESEMAQTSALPLYEYSWNHTTLHALKVDESITYLQMRFPSGDYMPLIADLFASYPNELLMHLEFIRSEYELTCAALPLVRFTTAARMQQLIEEIEARNITIFNPHTYILEDGGMKQTDPDQLAFKKLADPAGLLNPGKMKGWELMAAGQ